MNPIKDIAGAVGAKIQNYAANHRLVEGLMKNLPEGVVGSKNYDTHYNTMMHMVNNNKQEDAVKYSKSQEAKIQRPSRFSRTRP